MDSADVSANAERGRALLRWASAGDEGEGAKVMQHWNEFMFWFHAVGGCFPLVGLGVSIWRRSLNGSAVSVLLLGWYSAMTWVYWMVL